MGICDTILTSGSWAVSGNAPGIPKVQISIQEFYSLPIFGKLFAFKGNFAHGWIGETSVLYGNVYQVETWLHQKSLYGRIGKPEWKFKLYGGFNHQVFWGNEKDYYGDSFKLSTLKTFWYVFTGSSYGTTDIPPSRIGNHLGSVDLGFEYKFKNARLLAYRQSMYDAGALSHLANLRDGLNGLSLENLNNSLMGFHWRKILFEVLYTKSQGGESWSEPRSTGPEDYYNNWQYILGWSYKGLGIGNPFITSRAYTREGLPSDPGYYFINNRVIAFHSGYEAVLQNWDFILKASYSLNYGTYWTSEEGYTVGGITTPPMYGVFNETRQFSAYIGASRELNNGLNIGFTGAVDVGELFYDAFGVMFNVRKEW
jgi:hypothetical protein